MSSSPATADLPASAAPPAGRESHLIYLVLSVAVLFLAMLMSVEGEARVDLPYLGQLPTLCHLKRLTGLDCPGCGLTRCFIAVAHGDLTRAWHYNPAGLFVFAVVAGQIPFRAVQLWRLRRGLPELCVRRLGSVLIALIVSALLLQWLAKLLFLGLAWGS